MSEGTKAYIATLWGKICEYLAEHMIAFYIMLAIIAIATLGGTLGFLYGGALANLCLTSVAANMFTVLGVEFAIFFGTAAIVTGFYLAALALLSAIRERKPDECTEIDYSTASSDDLGFTEDQLPEDQLLEIYSADGETLPSDGEPLPSDGEPVLSDGEARMYDGEPGAV